MNTLRLDRLLDFLTSTEFFVGLLWGGLVGLALALILLMRTRWGESRIVEKCLALSVLVHLWLLGYSTTIKLVSVSPAEKEPIARVALNEDASPTPDAESRPPRAPDALAQEKPWDAFGRQWALRPSQIELARQEPKPAAPDRSPRDLKPGVAHQPRLDQFPLVEIQLPAPKTRAEERRVSKPQAEGSVEPIDPPAPQRREGARAQVVAEAPPPRWVPLQPRRTARSSPGPTDSPSPVLERPLALPRLSGLPSSPEPAPTLPGPHDALARPSARPAEATPSLAARTPGKDSSRLGPEPQPTHQADSLKVPSAIGQSGEPGRVPAGGLSAGEKPSQIGPPALPRVAARRSDSPMPELYRLRVAPNRTQLAAQLGASDQVETAVKAALKWLADNQDPDGRWNASRHGGGKETLEAGRDRQGAGASADPGVTGLAVLAFAAAGHTHLEGSYQATVRRAVEYLLNVQGPDGNLAGQAQIYEFMYCHAMATLALSELAGMTGDESLREPLSRAVGYTLAAQDPVGGGWRYRPREPGDTSQLGWQIMALKSAELAGISIPPRTWQGALRFLDSVSGGTHRGLAAYRPSESISRSMTAEALVCRLFLGLPIDSPAAREAADYLLEELPGQGDPNLYYWYYASIAMHQLQGPYWKRWSEALQNTLLATQKSSGPLAGSWDPNTRWDAYGGRVYSTALATLCLEAFYRFLPLSSLATPQTKSPEGKHGG